jgi:uncharacterized membrane protein
MNPVTRRLSIALAVSVALNLFGAGFLVSRALHHRPPPPGLHALHAPDERFEGGPFMGPRGLLGSGAGPHMLPRVREVMQAHGKELREGRGELREKRHAVEDALRAEPFDAAALGAALAGLRQSTNAAQERMHAALVDLAKTLPAEERRELARHGQGHRGHMGMHGDGGLKR